jgi:hypothetical protein
VSEEDTVMAVDALASDGMRALWRVSQVGGRVMALEADAESLRFATWGSEPQLWTYSLPGGPTLRSRARRRAGDGFPLWVLNEETGRVERMDALISAPPWTLTQLQIGEHSYEVGLNSKGDVSRALFVFEGQARVQHRFSGGDLLLFDTAGRLLRVDLTEGIARRVHVQ